jgi:hypothetical protein
MAPQRKGAEASEIQKEPRLDARKREVCDTIERHARRPGCASRREIHARPELAFEERYASAARSPRCAAQGSR